MRDDDDDEGRSGPGWIAGLFGAALLLAAGFAVGVVVGAVREEPAMLLRYVAGKGAVLPAPPPSPGREAQPEPAPPAQPATPVPTQAARPAGDAPPATGAPPPAPRATAEAAPRAVPSAAPPAPAAARSVGTAAVTRARFAVQVGAFAQSAEAEKLEAELARKGLPAYVQPATGARDSRWRVRVGPLATRDEADRLATKLKTQEGLPVWVLEESG